MELELAGFLQSDVDVLYKLIKISFFKPPCLSPPA